MALGLRLSIGEFAMLAMLGAALISARTGLAALDSVQVQCQPRELTRQTELCWTISCGLFPSRHHRTRRPAKITFCDSLPDAAMPTYHKPQLDETSMPWLEIWDLMRRGLGPVARQILALTYFYEERDIEPPPAEVPLSLDEEAELCPVVSALTMAAVVSEQMKSGPLVSTLGRLYKSPEIFNQRELPAAVLWELAQDICRDAEPPGTFSMDVWGSEQTAVPYARVEPSDVVIAAAAARAAQRNRSARSSGRPDHPAHEMLAERLAAIFAKSEKAIVRKRAIVDCKDGVPRYAEEGDFFNFLEMVLPPLREFLRERRLAPVTSDAIVRAAQEHVKESLALHPPSTPDYSHNFAADCLD